MMFEKVSDVFKAAFVLTISMILFTGTGMAFSGAGSGTESDPYQVTDWNELDEVRNDLGAYYWLMNDLNSSTAGYDQVASSTANSGNGFNPIGDSSNYFTGSFEGNGYTISNLTIDRSGEHYVGLFGSSNGGTIMNTSLEDVDVTGSSYTGGLVGSNMGTVRKSYVTGDVSGNDYVGSLVGQNYFGTVDRSYATASVDGTDYVGGLVGQNYNGGEVNHSYATGPVTGSSYVGGLIGGNSETVDNSYWNTETTGQDTSAGGTGLTTSEMKGENAKSNMNFDFSNKWEVVTSNNQISYPYLLDNHQEPEPGLRNTVHVVDDDGGEDFIDVQEAVNYALDGEKVIVNSGTYSRVEVNKSITLEGSDTGSGMPVIDGQESGSAVEVTVANVTLDGFNITNSSSSSSGVLLDRAENVTVKNSNVYNNYQGIYLDYTDNNNISNNHLHSNSEYGVELNDANNNIIENNLVEENSDAIYVGYSEDNNFSENTVKNNSEDGFFLEYSYHNSITNNTITENDDYGYGVNLDGSDHNTIANNNLTKNYDGIWIYESNSNYAVNNSITGIDPNGNAIGLGSGSSSNDIFNNSILSSGFSIDVDSENNNIPKNNTVNGEPVYFYENVSDKTIEEPVGQAIIKDSENITVQNTVINQTNIALSLLNATETSIINNEIRNISDLGIDFTESTNNTIENNNLTENSGTSFWFDEFSHNNTIIGNKIRNNTGNSIYIYKANDIRVISNNISQNTAFAIIYASTTSNTTVWNNTLSNNDPDYRRGAIYMEYSCDNSNVSNNVIEDNTELGIHLEGKDHDVVDNTIINNANDPGIDFRAVNTSTIRGNNITGNGRGIEFDQSHENTIIGNDITDNGNTGVLIYNSYGPSNNNTVVNNSITANQNGVELSYSHYNLLEDNKIASNSNFGVYLSSANNTAVNANNITFNSDDGVNIDNSFNNTVVMNNITSNDNGVYIIEDSKYNNISSNNISQNDGSSDAGVYISGSGANNTLTSNRLMNNYYGISLYGSANNTLDSNLIKNNERYGVQIESSGHYNKLFNNSFVSDGLDITSDSKNNVVPVDGSLKNTVNGEPLYFYENESDKIIEGSAGQVVIMDSENFTVRDTYINETTKGILLLNTNESKITNNTLKDNYRGLEVINSRNNSVTENNITNNSYGIYLEYSTDNSIYMNNVMNNSDDQAYLWNSDGNSWVSPDNITYNYSESKYSSQLGNYWSDYGGDGEGDGTGVSDYTVNGVSDTEPLVGGISEYEEKVYVESINVTAQPSLSYKSGDSLDLSGLEVTETYDDGSNSVVTFTDGTHADYTANPSHGTELGESDDGSTVTINHTDSGETANTDNLTVEAEESGGGTSYYFEEKDGYYSEEGVLKMEVKMGRDEKRSLEPKDQKGTGVSKLTLETEGYSSGEVEISKKDSLPEECEVSEDSYVYRILQIDSTIDKEDLKKASLWIEVNNSWKERNEIKEVEGTKCKPSGNGLNSSLMGRNESVTTYNLSSSGFSTWVVFGISETEDSEEINETVKAVLEDVEVKSQPTLVYNSGESLDLGGMVIVETYTDGTMENISYGDDVWSSNYSADPSNGTVLDENFDGTAVTVTHTNSMETADTETLTVNTVGGNETQVIRDDKEEDLSCFTVLNICWYWWLAVILTVIVVVAVFYLEKPFRDL